MIGTFANVKLKNVECKIGGGNMVLFLFEDFSCRRNDRARYLEGERWGTCAQLYLIK